MQTRLGSYRRKFHLNLAAAVSVPALLAGAALPAAAADLSYKDDRPAIVGHTGGGYGWAGFYLGAHAGGVISDDDDAAPFSTGSNAGGGGGGGGAAGLFQVGGAGGLGGNAFSSFSNTDDGNDALAGVHIGYNWQKGNLVYGVEADLDAKDSFENVLGSLRARLGFGSDRALFYVTGGLAYFSTEGTSGVFIRGASGDGGDGGDAFLAPGDPGGAGTGATTVGSFSTGADSGWGWVIGGGLEYKVTQQVGLGLEGLYYSFDESSGFSTDEDFFTIRARLTMHLDRSHGDSSFKDSYPALASNWGGFYIGGHAGAQFSSDDSVEHVDFNAGGDGGDGGDGIGINAGGGGGGGGGGGTALAQFGGETGLLGGAHIGYNWQSGRWVYGLEGDASFGDSERFDYLASARARLGYTSGSYLFYATGGVAFAGIKQFDAIFAGAGEDGEDGGNALLLLGNRQGGEGGAGGIAGALSSENDEVGFVLGGGVEAKLSDRMTVGFEGLYYFFDDNDADLDAIPGGTTAILTGSDNDTLVLRGRISYQLSHGRDSLK